MYREGLEGFNAFKNKKRMLCRACEVLAAVHYKDSIGAILVHQRKGCSVEHVSLLQQCTTSQQDSNPMPVK